jgi:hypothetical protein
LSVIFLSMLALSMWRTAAKGKSVKVFATGPRPTMTAQAAG